MRLFILLLICISHLSVAQTGIKGKVVDQQYQPLPDVTILLLQATDSSWIATDITDVNGHFNFRHTAPGSYLIMIQKIGYLQQLTAAISAHDTTEPVYVLQQSGNTTLSAFILTAKHPFVETALGKTIVHFPPESLPASNTLLDILRKSPGVIVDGNGNISLQGKGVMVMIDDKPTYFSGKELSDYLRSIAADQVDQVELMTQPPAKYDAEGNGGIINIKTKKDKDTGLKGNANVSLSLAQRTDPATFNSLNMNYRNRKFNVFANAGYLHAQGYLDLHSDRLAHNLQDGTVQSTISENGFFKETFEDYSLQIGGDYFPCKKLTVGASIRGVYHPNKEKDRTNSILTNTDGPGIVNSTTFIEHKMHKNNITANAYGKYSFSKDREISMDLDYFIRDYRNEQYLLSTNNDSTALQLHYLMPSTIKVYVARMDYSGPLFATAKIEAGLKSSYVDTRNATFSDIMQQGYWQYDTIRSNDFYYQESITAAYLNASRKLGEKWEIQAGLRLEHTHMAGQQLMNNQDFRRSFTSLFPTFFARYAINKHHSLEVNYGKRINRPSYVQLNPFIRYQSQYYYTVGNPYLLPQYEHSLELKHVYKNMLFTSVNFGRKTDVMNPVLLYDTANQITVNTSRNNAGKNNIHGSVSFYKQLYDWWTLYTSADIYWQQYMLYGNKNMYAASIGYAYTLSCQLKSARGWGADIFLQYTSGDLQTMIERNKPAWWTSISISKGIWKGTSTITLTFEDPFGIYRYRSDTEWEGIQAYSSMKWANQRFSIGFNFNFGKNYANMQQHESKTDEARRL